MEKRREFIKKVAVTTASLAVGSKTLGFTANSYRKIIGANERIHVAMIGLNGRGSSMAGTFAGQKNLEISIVCDVDSRTIPKIQQIVTAAGQASAPRGEKD